MNKLILLALLTMSTSSFAQNAQLSGKLIDNLGNYTLIIQSCSANAQSNFLKTNPEPSKNSSPEVINKYKEKFMGVIKTEVPDCVSQKTGVKHVFDPQQIAKPVNEEDLKKYYLK